jgi:hypothetical protein
VDQISDERSRMGVLVYLWRPNLCDESDNHLMEPACAGGASVIVTNSLSEFRGADRIVASKRVIEEASPHPQRRRTLAGYSQSAITWARAAEARPSRL